MSWRAIRHFYPGRRTAIVALPEHDLVYVKNQKSGSSTIMVWLERLHTGDHDSDPAHMHRTNHLPGARDIGRRQVVRMLAGSAYRFSFVRHPLQRLESVYWAKMAPSRSYRLGAAPALGLPADPHAEVSFELFLSAVEDHDPLTLDQHWRPQHLNLLHPLVEYDHVGRLESFAADLERIREEAGLPMVPVTSKNVSHRDRGVSVYDGRPDLVRRVERLYAEDFELYGY